MKPGAGRALFQWMHTFNVSATASEAAMVSGTSCYDVAAAQRVFLLSIQGLKKNSRKADDTMSSQLTMTPWQKLPAIQSSSVLAHAFFCCCWSNTGLKEHDGRKRVVKHSVIRHSLWCKTTRANISQQLQLASIIPRKPRFIYFFFNDSYFCLFFV